MTRRALALVVALLALAPASAHASDQQLSMMMDDDLLVYRDDATRDRTLDRMSRLGVDYVRVTVLWSVVAERQAARNRGRRASSPRAYRALNWDRYDRLVRAAQARGMGVYFNVTPPAPPWHRGRAPRGERDVVRRAWRPDARAFARFVEAVGRRFSGRYRDENDGGQLIPRVSFWSLLNEPNQAGWLAPQWAGGRMESAVMARELYLRGRRALDRTGHGRDVILFGETAPLGSSRRGTRSPVRPARFLRAILCQTRGRGCELFDRFGRIRATGFAHHPYTKNVGPTRRDRHPDSLTLANLREMGALLDRLARRTRNLPRSLPIYLTEFGWETNPPDRFNGVSLARQAEWIQQGEFITYANPRVRALTQFLLRDVPPVRGISTRRRAAFFTYQSGLEFVNGQPKPAMFAYVFPFRAFSAGGLVANVWGQLKFRPNALPPGAQDQVQLQFRPAGGSADWRPLGARVTVTNPLGYFTATVRLPAPGSVRATWGGGAVGSLPVAVGG